MKPHFLLRDHCRQSHGSDATVTRQLLATQLAAFWHGQALGPDLGASPVRSVPSSTEIAQAVLLKVVRLGQEVGWQ